MTAVVFSIRLTLLGTTVLAAFVLHRALVCARVNVIILPLSSPIASFCHPRRSTAVSARMVLFVSNVYHASDVTSCVGTTCSLT